MLADVFLAIISVLAGATVVLAVDVWIHNRRQLARDRARMGRLVRNTSAGRPQ